METKPEVFDSSAETEMMVPETEHIESAPIALSRGHMDDVIQIAAKVGAYAKAMDQIIGTIIQRAYENDFVCHDRSDVPILDRKANIGAACAERIAAFLGITERNWKVHKEVSDDGKRYTWIHEADFSLGSRAIHAMGQAGTQDKFFGYANQQWKPLEDVRESDIRMASQRACRKEGVRTLLGLRNIPITRLKALGMNVDKIKMVNFQTKIAEEEKKAVDTKGIIWKDIKVVSVTEKNRSKDPKKPWILWNVSDGKIQYTMFAGQESNRLMKLQLCEEDQSTVKVGIKLGTYNGQDTYEIVSIEGIEETK